MDQPEIFDRTLRRLRRDRAARMFADHSFLIEHMADELAERLAIVTRAFGRVFNATRTACPLPMRASISSCRRACSTASTISPARSR
jgi:hypothetical protein